MGKRLEGRVAVIFGGSGHVGPAVCKHFAKEGATVIVHSHPMDPKEKVEGIVREIEQCGGQAIAMYADATDEQALGQMVQQVERACGRIDIAVNLIYPEGKWSPRPILDTEWEHWGPHFVALHAHFNICKQVVPVMRRQHYGRIVYISGGLAYRFFKECGLISTIKAGLNAFNKTLALESGEDHITVNIIAPGRIVPQEEATAEAGENRRHAEDSLSNSPLRRFCTPEDVAKAAAFFASDDALCITGQTLYVSGGEIMPMP